MSTEAVFRVHLILGYLAWLMCFGTYLWPKLRQMEPVQAHRAIATLHSFRFFGLVFILPGVAGHLPAEFATDSAYGDLATGLLALLALMTVRIRALFWTFVVSFNVVGLADLAIDYYHAILLGVPAMAGEFASTYWVTILYVPLLTITHGAAFYLMLRLSRPRAGAAAA